MAFLKKMSKLSSYSKGSEDVQLPDCQFQSHFGQLPEEVLLCIADFVQLEDVTRLSMTCRRFRTILPSYLIIKGHDLHESGPDAGNKESTHYFDGPKLTREVRQITMSMGWHDQVKIHSSGIIHSVLVNDLFHLLVLG